MPHLVTGMAWVLLGELERPGGAVIRAFPGDSGDGEAKMGAKEIRKRL